jgi:hypothetical protein
MVYDQDVSDRISDSDDVYRSIKFRKYKNLMKL